MNILINSFNYMEFFCNEEMRVINNQIVVRKYVPDKKFLTDKNKHISLKNRRKKTILIFLSTYCIRCINMLSELHKLKLAPKLNVRIFTEGTLKDHQDIKKSYSLKFPFIHISEEDQRKEFQVTVHPYYIIVNEKAEIEFEGEVKEINDILDRLMTRKVGL